MLGRRRVAKVGKVREGVVAVESEQERKRA